MIKGATISNCGDYRYHLSRIWDDKKPKVLFIMLNPSTADSEVDDPTIRRCMNFAKSWGYGGLYVGNLFAFRSKNPKELLNQIDPIGSLNKSWLDNLRKKSEIVVCAWGNSPILKKYGKTNIGNYQPILGWENLYCIEQSKDGTPKHPLYLKGDLKPIEMQIPEL